MKLLIAKLLKVDFYDITALNRITQKIEAPNSRIALWKTELLKSIERADQYEGLRQMGIELASYLTLLEKTTMDLGTLAAEKGPDAYLADATLYLEMFGVVVIAWQWLTMARAASFELEKGTSKKKESLFYEGKIHVAAYFFSHELPKAKSLSMTLTRKDKVTLSMPDACFTD